MSNVPVYKEPGGERMVVAAGGEIDILAGGALKVAGVDVTDAIAAALAGTAAGKKVAFGEAALDGSNPTPIVTGLATVDAIVAVLKKTTSPGVGTSVLTTDEGSAGTANVYAWKVTASNDATLVASTGTEGIYWVALGT
jgi:hypothetical protein